MFPSQNRSLRLSGYQDRTANSVPSFGRAGDAGFFRAFRSDRFFSAAL